jgi:hypothetical protein
MSEESKTEQSKTEQSKTEETKIKVNLGTNWNGNNISTLLNWISISQYNIECFDLAINYLRQQIRFNIILGLLLSTASGTISVANISFVSNVTVNLVLNCMFTAMSFIIAINTGRIKIYQVQERLEQFIKLKHDWTFFVTKIVTELQLPVDLRKDALYIIQTYREKFLDLIKAEVELPVFIKKTMEKKIKEKFEDTWHKNSVFYHIHGSYTHSGIEVKNIIEDIAITEGLRLIQAERQPNYSPDMPLNAFYKTFDVNTLWNELYKLFYVKDDKLNKLLPDTFKKWSDKDSDISSNETRMYV